ncbi:uncharacterized protein [Argopecten irradians]|uniref:uncharacterized protein n=1 Tax=Argopecten irradians TaxID=31199 RepID=UPI00371C089E
MTTPCMTPGYSCQDGYCCPQKFSTEDKCPGDALPELMDGAVRMCPNGICGPGYSCQYGYCCPVRLFTGVCANGGNPAKHDGQMVKCSMERPCNQSGYNCSDGYCCPAKVYGDSCPNGGEPQFHDHRPQTCHNNKTCDGSGMYACDGGYCCPQRVAYGGHCPNGGMPAKMDGIYKSCNINIDCGQGSYTCYNEFCCPVPVQSGMCPFNGIPDKMETGETRMCNRTTPCMTPGYSCQEGYCCPRKYSTEGKCPGDALPEIMDGAIRTCPINDRCGPGYSCLYGHCCPVRIFTGFCGNGGNPAVKDDQMVMCSKEKPCAQSGYTCRDGYCCPAKVYGDDCPNGGEPMYHDGRPQTCHPNKTCDGMYMCDGGFCCPQRVAYSGPCPNGGMPAQMDGTDKQCQVDVDCGHLSYMCTNNHCCPVPVQSGMCPFNGIPDKMETGETRMCNMTTPCMTPGYSCQDGYCCPQKFSTEDKCPGDALPELMDGAVRTCPNNDRCGPGYSCQYGYCCPVRLFTGVCDNGGNPAMSDDRMVKCSKEKPCRQSGYTCNGGYCCPAKVYGGACPNGGKPAYHDHRPQTCHNNKTCDESGMYACDGGYCCPQRVAFGGPCPNGGMPAQMDGMDKICIKNEDCGSGSYTCNNNHCCPVPVQSGMCPFNGIPDKMETGETRMCNMTTPCMTPGYSCQNGYCCPQKFSTEGKCPSDALPEMMDGAIRMCPNNGRCGPGYSCQYGYCCPVRIFTGVCGNGGNPARHDGQMVMCSKEKPCRQSGYTCNGGYCCPAKVYGGACPNGGKPAYHDHRPQTCHPNKTCDGGGMYACDGGYCCPQRVAYKSPCPKGGIAEQMYGRDKFCVEHSDCGHKSYMCTNNYCCPVPVQSDLCPFNGIPDKMETGEPRMCNRTTLCTSPGYSCQNGYCCPQKFSTEGKCPGDALPEIMDGAIRTCPINDRCGPGYSCLYGHCCPVRVFTDVCANGGKPAEYHDQMVTCSREKPCTQSGYTCSDGYCCPAKVYGGACPKGGEPAYHDHRPQTCHYNKTCNGGGMYACDGGYCCPQKVTFSGPCPNGGMPAQMDGTDKSCDKDLDCGQGSYMCTNNRCCPVPVQSGMCPFNGIPDKMKTGETRMCNRTTPCVTPGYSCQDGYCCPQKFSTESKCAGDAFPETMDGIVRMCSHDKMCGSNYKCQYGHCCPVRVFTGGCANGGNVLMDDDKNVTCSNEKPCTQAGYRCNEAGYCCPIRVYTGACPNGGEPAYHDRRPRTCHSNKTCDGGGMYACDGGYCCPQKVTFSGFCPYGGVAEQLNNQDRMCYSNDTNSCRVSYSCTNNQCCPQVTPKNGNYCPFGGLVERMDKEPKKCNMSSTVSQCRSKTHHCVEGYCCPAKVTLQGHCPGGSMPEMMGDVPKRCDDNTGTSICSPDSFCMNNLCCSKAIIAKGPCSNGGGMKMDSNGKPVSCSPSTTTQVDQCGSTHLCEDVKGIMACCPSTVNISNLQDPCGPGAGPLLSTDQMSALMCEDDSTCPPRAFRCQQISGQTFKLCCPVKYNDTKPGECPVVPDGVMGTCAEMCSNDTDCMGDKKCCSNGCGHSCVAPTVNTRKPGRCPVLPTGTFGTCQQECSDDSKCPGDRKCCSNGCGHVCLAPDGPCGQDKPLEYTNGTQLYCGRGGQSCPADSFCSIGADDRTAVCCPAVPPCGKDMPLTYSNGTTMTCDRMRCPQYSNCVMDKGSKYPVCCPTRDYEDSKKCENYHGGLPVHMRNGTLYDCSDGKDCPFNSRCMTDQNRSYAVCCRETGGTKKPCNYYRGGEPKKYPNGTALSCGRTPNRVNCPDDYKCTVHPVDAFAVCCPRNASRPGTCPAVDEVTINTDEDTCADTCTVDTDCEGNMKCCRRGCGHTCMKPVMKKPLSECQKNQIKAIIDLHTEGDICASVFIPRCDRHGNYSRTQCQENTGVCWCVFPNGTEISGTRRIGRPQCYKATRTGQCPTVTMTTQNTPVSAAQIQCPTNCTSDNNCTTGQRCCGSAQCGLICQATRTVPEPELCPVGVKPMCCDFLQCVDHICPAYPMAKCRMNPCGGCRVEFYDKYSNKVNCTEGLTPCELQRMKANMKKGNTTRRERLQRYVYMIKQEEMEREDKDMKKPDDTVPTIDHKDKMDDICRLPMEKGSGNVYNYRYYYNHTAKVCVRFKYSGRGGNKNNFEDSNTCYKTCATSQGVPPFCIPTPKVGDCKALIPKYFYNVTTKKCEIFYWGGCGSLTNLFDSEDLCLSKCAPVDICQIRNCGPEYICQPTGDRQADCIPKNRIQSGFQSYVPGCERDGSFSPQQCIGNVCWCVNPRGVPDNTTISLGDADCSGNNTGSQKPDLRCPDNSKPMMCGNECQNKTCHGRTDVRCLINPCRRCEVKFVDSSNNEVQCDVNPCDMGEPRMIARPAGGCTNAARRWFFNKNTQMCENFKYATNCYGKDSYFKSLLDCRNQCKGSPCGDSGTLRTCTNTCANLTCRYYPNATCKVNPCTCQPHFIDPVSMEVVNCSKFITQCQKNRTKALLMYSQQAAAGTAPTNLSLPQCREDGRFSNQQCDETHLVCWCVNQAGRELPRTRIRVSSIDVDIGCKDKNLTHALVVLRFNRDFSLVRGREMAFIGVIKAALGPNIAREIRDITLREGSIIADMTVSGESDPTVVASEIEEEVKNGDLKVEFEGTTLTADPDSVTTSLVFQAQTGNEEITPISRQDGSDKRTIIALVITIVVLAAVLIAIALFVLYKRKQEKNDFSSLEDSKMHGHNNPVYNQAYETK